MLIKLGCWWIVLQLTFRSSSHHLNWSYLRYEALYLCCKVVSLMLYILSCLIPICHHVFMFAGSSECYTDSGMFCLPLCNLPQTHRFDSGCPPMFGGRRGSHWLVSPQTITPSSRTGDKVLLTYWESQGPAKSKATSLNQLFKCRVNYNFFLCLQLYQAQFMTRLH